MFLHMCMWLCIHNTFVAAREQHLGMDSLHPMGSAVQTRVVRLGVAPFPTEPS